MSDPAAILEQRAFWLYYTQAEETPLDESVLRYFGTKTINGREYPEAVFPLPCGDTFELVVRVSSGLGYEINLGLSNTATDRLAEMGWWDEARWHPYALRWQELAQLHEYWLKNLEPNVHPSAAFLLLAQFVGNGVEEQEQFAARRAAIYEHYEQLQLFSHAELARLSGAYRLPSAEEYTWAHDAELGWVFRGKYPCYSLRNRQHAGGAEGRFPFSDWAAAIANL